MRRLQNLLHSTAARCPEHVAVEDPGVGQWTYRELDSITSEWRAALLEAGVVSGDRVGICAKKSLYSLGSLLAVLKAEGAYVPVDATAPAQRNAYIFDNCSVKALVVDKTILPALAETFEKQYGYGLVPVAEFGPSLVLVRPARPVDTVYPEPRPEIAYILYTSGSTGSPKGVMISHANALSYVDWCSDTFSPDEEDRFSSHAPFHFDLSILDIYVPIKHGATLILISEETGKQPAALAALISERRITSWYSTPSILRLLLEYGKLRDHDYSALRFVHFAGEVFPVKHLRALHEIWPHPRYFNLYGPTETNVCTFYEVIPPISVDRIEPYPIGKPCSHCRTRVVEVDEEGGMHDVDEGELVVDGESVMLGYWNLPQQTTKAFCRDNSGQSWYRTGDIVKTDAGGDYIFISRRDRMVKRRSYRVELGEIEAALYRHPQVAEAAVVALPDEESGVIIKAFLATNGRPSVIEMKQFCAANLPAYMIPDRFAFETSLPKTSTDKTDYQKLIQMA